ncbi:MAG TPA: secretin N-terminal domain-containing protein, partial [Gammaproteobacteria bacterium]
MNPLRIILPLIIVLFGLLTAQAYAADRIEVIPLKNRSAEELMPLIRPLLDQGEALSGTGYQLIVRAAPERQDEIRSLIAQLDQATRQLRISVRRAAREEIERERAQANIVVIGSGGGHVEARGGAIVRSTRDKGGERNNFQVTALEGTPAYINTGEAFPVPTQSGYIVNGQPMVTQGIEYQQLSSGFYALART